MRFHRIEPLPLRVPRSLTFTISFNDGLLDPSQGLYERRTRAREVNPHVPLPEKRLPSGETHPSLLELQRRPLPPEMDTRGHGDML